MVIQRLSTGLTLIKGTCKAIQYVMRIVVYLWVVLFFLFSCSNSTTDDSIGSSDSYEEYSESDEMDESEQGFADGTYSATVDYYNPETGYSATYTLDVEVENNEVTVIYFPNDGYLDEDHIWPDELDENGFVQIDGEDGKTYDVQIDF